MHRDDFERGGILRTLPAGAVGKKGTLLPVVDGWLARWSQLWGRPGLETRVTVRFSERLRRALGRCLPATGEIRLNARLLTGPEPLLLETLCHELAHVAVHEGHGPSARPHGPEWAALMQTAGFAPRARAQLSEDVRSVIAAPNQRRFTYEHRCPVCHAARIARRPVRGWRCVACLRSGGSGRLVITRYRN
jgi:SprT protein